MEIRVIFRNQVKYKSTQKLICASHCWSQIYYNFKHFLSGKIWFKFPFWSGQKLVKTSYRSSSTNPGRCFNYISTKHKQDRFTTCFKNLWNNPLWVLTLQKKNWKLQKKNFHQPSDVHSPKRGVEIHNIGCNVLTFWSLHFLN